MSIIAYLTEEKKNYLLQDNIVKFQDEVSKHVYEDKINHELEKVKRPGMSNEQVAALKNLLKETEIFDGFPDDFEDDAEEQKKASEEGEKAGKELLEYIVKDI
jgi:hypothetical protein